MKVAQKLYSSSGGTLALSVGLLLLLSAPLVLMAQRREARPLSNSYAYYQGKVAETQASDPFLARHFADSMLMAASIASDSTGLAESMKYIGDLYDRTGDFSKAIIWLHRSLAIANRLGDRSMAVRIHNNLGGVYLKTSNYEKALSQYNRAYSLGRTELTSLQKAILLNNLGTIYRHLEQYRQSKVYYQESLDLYTQLDNHVGMGQVYNNLGILAQIRKQFDESEEYFLKAIALSETNQRSVGTAYSTANLGGLYVEIGKAEKAMPYLYRAHALKKQMDDKLGLFNSHCYIGLAWIKQGLADSAAYHYYAASLYADSIQNISKKLDALTGLAQAFELKGITKEQPRLYEQILILKDSAYRQDKADQLAIAQAELELAQKDEAILELAAEAEEKSTKLRSRELVLLFIVPLLLLLLIFIVFYVRRFRSERKAHHQLRLRHEEIRRQKEKIEEQHLIIQQQNQELFQANKLIEQYNDELEAVNEQLEDKIRERTRALSDTYRKLAFHINNTPLAVLEWNKELTLVRWPDQAEKIFGYAAKQVLGVRAEDLPFMNNEEHLNFLHGLQHASPDLRNQQGSFLQELRQEDGDLVWVEWSHSVLTDENGQVESVLSIANDVSLRQKAFHELSEINQELDTFIYKASHDLRGPIARMQGIINLGKIESQDKQAHFYFDLLNRVADELINLLTRLLMVHDVHQHQLSLETFNFHEFVEEKILEMQKKPKAEAFNFLNQIPQDLLIQSDKNLLHIILVNLLDNSINFADNEGPYVVLNAKVLNGNKLHFSVQDNGPGIAENLHERVFDMFFRGSIKSTGMGLGLYMVRKAVRRLGGEVKLDERNGLTTFSVLLPESEMMRVSPVPEPKKISLV